MKKNIVKFNKYVLYFIGLSLCVSQSASAMLVAARAAATRQPAIVNAARPAVTSSYTSSTQPSRPSLSLKQSKPHTESSAATFHLNQLKPFDYSDAFNSNSFKGNPELLQHSSNWKAYLYAGLASLGIVSLFSKENNENDETKLKLEEEKEKLVKMAMERLENQLPKLKIYYRDDLSADIQIALQHIKNALEIGPLSIDQWSDLVGLLGVMCSNALTDDSQILQCLQRDVAKDYVYFGVRAYAYYAEHILNIFPGEFWKPCAYNEVLDPLIQTIVSAQSGNTQSNKLSLCSIIEGIIKASSHIKQHQKAFLGYFNRGFNITFYLHISPIFLNLNIDSLESNDEIIKLLNTIEFDNSNLFCERLIMDYLLKNSNQFSNHQEYIDNVIRLGLKCPMIYNDDAFGKPKPSKNISLQDQIVHLMQKSDFNCLKQLVGSLSYEITNRINVLYPDYHHAVGQMIQDWINSLNMQELSINQIIRALLLKKAFPEITGISREVINQSPTLLHLQQLDGVECDAIMNQFLNNKNLSSLLDDLIKKEIELDSQGYYTFLHAQRSEYYFLERINTFIFSQIEETHLNDFMFLHVKRKLISDTELKEDKRIGERIIKNGRMTDTWHNGDDREARARQLFLNRALFANDGNHGSNSAFYLTGNCNAGHIQLSAKDVFDLWGQRAVYENNQEEIHQLELKYSNQDFGNLVLVAIPKEKVDKLVIPVSMGGYKRSVKIKSDGMLKYIFDSKNIHSSNELLKAWSNTPETFIDSHDTIEYALVMTHDRGLDPKSGIKVFPLIPRSKDEIDSLQAEERKLLAKIEADFARNNSMK